jgi:hypothetical protein
LFGWVGFGVEIGVINGLSIDRLWFCVKR